MFTTPGVESSGFRVEGVWGLEFKRFGVQGFGFRVEVLGFRVRGSGGLGFSVRQGGWGLAFVWGVGGLGVSITGLLGAGRLPVAVTELAPPGVALGLEE
jgi:hypothetical protein